ncbi:hypothetical protein STENM327S_05212 [Streptomyces tendae]
MKKRLCATVAVLGVLTAPAAQASPHPAGHPSPTRQALPLGPAGLPETRTTTTLQPGVTLTRIVRGNADDPALHWTVEVSIPGGDTSPAPTHRPRPSRTGRAPTNSPPNYDGTASKPGRRR